MDLIALKITNYVQDRVPELRSYSIDSWILPDDQYPRYNIERIRYEPDIGQRNYNTRYYDLTVNVLHRLEVLDDPNTHQAIKYFIRGELFLRLLKTILEIKDLGQGHRAENTFIEANRRIVERGKRKIIQMEIETEHLIQKNWSTD